MREEEQDWVITHKGAFQVATAVHYTKTVNNSGQSRITCMDSALHKTSVLSVSQRYEYSLLFDTRNTGYLGVVLESVGRVHSDCFS